MKATVQDYDGWFRIKITAENNDERMLLAAFVREHVHASHLFQDCIESDSNGWNVTLGEVPPPRKS